MLLGQMTQGCGWGCGVLPYLPAGTLSSLQLESVWLILLREVKSHDKGTRDDRSTLNMWLEGQDGHLPSPSSARAALSSNKRPVNKASCPACWKTNHQRREKTLNHAHLEYVWTMPTAPRETCLFSHHFLERGDERMLSTPVAFEGWARLSNEAVSSLSWTRGRRLAGLRGEGEAT